MLDIRVLKKMASWVFYGIALFVLFSAASYVEDQILNVTPDTVVYFLVSVFGLYTLYQMAKIHVDMERNNEQRLLDKMRDMK